MRALKRMSIGSMWSASASSVRALTSGACPLSVCSKSSARISSSRLMATSRRCQCTVCCASPNRCSEPNSSLHLRIMLRHEQRDGAGRDAALIRSVDRAIAILDVLAARRLAAPAPRWRASSASTARPRCGCSPPSSATRLVERDPRTAKYRLGRRLAQLASVGHAARSTCATSRGRSARRSPRALGETVTLDVLDGDEIVPDRAGDGLDLGGQRQLAGHALAGPLHGERQGDPRVRPGGGPGSGCWPAAGAPHTAHDRRPRRELEAQLGRRSRGRLRAHLRGARGRA